MVRDWTRDTKDHADSTTFTLVEETKGFQWCQTPSGQAVRAVSVSLVDGKWTLLELSNPQSADVFIVTAQNSTIPYEEWCHQLNVHTSNWNTFHSFLHSYYIVRQIAPNTFQCSCPVGVKKPVCKHIVGIRYKFLNLLLREEAKQYMLGAKRQCGRPKKMGRALAMI
jgi:hypothetical protein